jgi:hypothetical protein
LLDFGISERGFNRTQMALIFIQITIEVILRPCFLILVNTLVGMY